MILLSLCALQEFLPRFLRCGVGAVCFIPIYCILLSPLITEEHVLSDWHLRYESQLLMNDNNSLFLGICYLMKLTNLAFIDNISFIAPIRIDTAKNVHKSRLTGSVLSYQCMDLSLLNLKVNIIESLYTGESLGDILHFKEYFSQGYPSISSYSRTSHQVEQHSLLKLLHHEPLPQV